MTAESLRGATFYEWEQSGDGGATWISLPSTPRSKTTASGFSPGQRVIFRFRPVTREGARDWSQPLAIVVA
jgi:hypothetical protein